MEGPHYVFDGHISGLCGEKGPEFNLLLAFFLLILRMCEILGRFSVTSSRRCAATK